MEGGSIQNYRPIDGGWVGGKSFHLVNEYMILT